MAIRKPLVIVNGQIEQLQSGDVLQEVEQLQLTADAAMIAGQVLYASAADHVNKARANSAGTMLFLGLAVAAISNGSVGGVQTEGVVTLTTGEWDAVFGTTGGLTFNSLYYMSAATAGLGTATAPTVVGQYVVPIGLAISTTELQLLHMPSILL